MILKEAEAWRRITKPTGEGVWRPPGTGIRSSVLGTKTHTQLEVRVAGSAGGTAVTIGRGVKGKGAFPNAGRQGGRMLQATKQQPGNTARAHTANKAAAHTSVEAPPPQRVVAVPAAGPPRDADALGRLAKRKREESKGGQGSKRAKTL